MVSVDSSFESLQDLQVTSTPLIFHSNQLRTMMFRKKIERFYYTETHDQFNPLTHGCHEKLTPTQTARDVFRENLKKNYGCCHQV